MTSPALDKKGALAPVLVFAFARPDHLRRTMESLQANAEAGLTHVTVFCDGPRNPSDVPQVEAVRRYVDALEGFASVSVVRQPHNLGLAQSVILGVTQMLEQHEDVIVVEDDLLLSPYFLKYMNDALNHYRHDERVASIHGYSYPTDRPLPATFFLRGADCWGWATWRRAWAGFNPDGRALLSELERQRRVRHFDFDGAYPYTRMLRDQISGKNSSWAVRWHASCYLAGKLTLYPGRSLVENIGNDASGTHSIATSVYSGEIASRPVQVGNIDVAASENARNEIIRFLRGGRTWRAKALGVLKILSGVSG